MSDIYFFNEDCFETMNRMNKSEYKVDVILTSPPYNTGRLSTSERSRNNYEGKYDIYIDNKTQSGYCEWCVDLFQSFDSILDKNGSVLWNVSYGSDATVNKEGIGLIWLAIADIIRNTPFTVADRIIWKKGSALPNNVSPNKLTRIVEDVFVFCRKDEYKTFNANKEISKVGRNGQTFYKNTFNFIEAKNNDGSCDLNKATYSTDLCKQLLNIYAKPNSKVYDPFMGTGTTAKVAKNNNRLFIGYELGKEYFNLSIERLNGI